MTRRAPRSTRTYPLCPYTTLCRSLGGVVVAVDLRPHLHLLHDHLGLLALRLFGLDRHLVAVLAVVQQLADRRLCLRGDLHEVEVETLGDLERSEEHTSELQSLMRHSYAAFCLKQKKRPNYPH